MQLNEIDGTPVAKLILRTAADFRLAQTTLFIAVRIQP